MMIPYVNSCRFHQYFSPSRDHRERANTLSLGNKSLYICFLVAFAMAASPSRAAEPTALSVREPGPAPTVSKIPAVRETIVVRPDPRTGRLVRATVKQESVAPAPSKSKTPPKQIAEIVDKAAQAHQVDPLLVHSIIQVESNYNPYAISNKGAEGLMQLMPSTASMLGVSNSFDPQQNIEAGVKYLKYLQSVYKDDRLALAAYNAGPANVDKYKQVPPFKETQNYVEQVGRKYEDAKRANAPAAELATKTAAPVIAAAPPVEIHPKLEQSYDANGRLSLRTVE